MRAAARPPSALCVRRNVPTGRPVHPLGLQEVRHYTAHLQIQAWIFQRPDAKHLQGSSDIKWIRKYTCIQLTGVFSFASHKHLCLYTEQVHLQGGSHIVPPHTGPSITAGWKNAPTWCLWPEKSYDAAHWHPCRMFLYGDQYILWVAAISNRLSTS